MIRKINYADKSVGGKFTASDANEIKTSINSNADVLYENSQFILSLQGGSLGSIKPTDAAPTPARNGNYTFSIGGNKPAWLTAEAGITEVKAGDGVSVVYDGVSIYTYTHVNVSSEFVTEQEAEVIFNDILKLQSMFGSYWNGSTIHPASVTSGLFINIVGIATAISGTDDNCTDMIAAEGGKAYLYLGGILDGRSIAFYDSSQNFISAISGTSYAGAGVLSKKVKFKTPINTAFIRCSIYGSNGVYSLFKNGTEISTILDTVNTLNSKTLPLVGNVLNTATATVKTGYFISKTGVESAFTNSAIYDIVVNPNKLYLIKSARFTDGRGLCFYDSNNSFIDGYNGSQLLVGQSGIASGNENPNVTIMTPPGAVKMRLSTDRLGELPTIIEVNSSNYLQIWLWLQTINTNIVTISNKIGEYDYTKILQPNVAFYPTVESGNFFITKYGSIETGFIGDKVTDFIPVESDTYYRYLGKFSDGRGYVEYDENKTLVIGKNANELTVGQSTRVVTDYKFKTKSNTKYVRFSVFEVASYALYKESASINDTLNFIISLIGGTSELDYTADFPTYVFGIDNDSNSFYGREYVQNVYPESLLGQKIDVKVNGGRIANIQSKTKNTSNQNTTVVPIILSGKGYKTKSANVSLIKTKASVAKNKQIRYLAIGDSITANQLPQADGSFVGGWCYPSIAKEILMMDNKDFGDNAIKMLLLGTTNYKQTQFTYKGEALTLRGFSEGRGSWTTCNYLRHAAHTTTTGSGSGSSFDNKAAWDAMGLGRKIAIDSTYDDGATYENYTYATAQRELIRTTPWGKYHWDYSAELWIAAKANDINGIMDGAGTYSGSLSDKALLDVFMNYMLDNPRNPFYDKTVAKTTGSYGFSLAAYLNRYKTLADDGITRLAVGSTAGSLITEMNIDTIDVCTPTHITLELGENERWWYPATAQNAVDDNAAIMNAIATEFPTIKIGFVNPRYIGVMYPEYWADMAMCGSFDPAGSNAFKYQMNTIAKAYFGTLASQTNKFFLPCYYLQSPLFRQQSRNDINLVDKSNLIVGGTDPNHPGLLGYWGIAYQILSWIYYTL